MDQSLRTWNFNTVISTTTYPQLVEIWQQTSIYTTIENSNTSSTWIIKSNYGNLSSPPTTFVDNYVVQMCYLNFSLFKSCSTGGIGYDIQYDTKNTFNSRPFILTEKYNPNFFSSNTINYVPVCF